MVSNDKALKRVRRRANPPEEVGAILKELEGVLNIPDDAGRVVSNARFGAYAFYDYDGEPIYVGQTAEQLRVRIRRHLTNQRTDAVAMHVLDPFEVADIEMWPLWELEGAARDAKMVKATLNSAEYTVFKKVLTGSIFQAVLNEVPIAPTQIMALPPSLRARIVPEPIYTRRKHADVRIARRAETIAKLAAVISQRSVKPGLRNTLLVQATRLRHLAEVRLKDAGGPPEPGHYEEAETQGDA
ncbi:MAG: GIY-YIG nuclease family protein [SAR202 cluster bacterium]|nr:GIY-YIG nuclease family protein [SAR202 cluster bacterium]